MVYSPFFKLPFAVGGSGLGVVPSADMRPMFAPSPETDAVAHWDLGAAPSSLSDILAGRTLTPNAVAPTYDGLGLKIADGGMNGLISDIADKAAGFTVAMVVQLQTTMAVTGQSSMLVGTMQQGSGGDGLGGGIFTNGSPGTTLNILNNARNNGTSQQLIRSITPLNLGVNWYFILQSVDAAGNRFVYIPGFSILTDGPTKTPSPTRKLALGNGYYIDPTYGYGQRFSEFIVWDRGLTQAEAIGVALRTKDRLAYKKGISIYGL